MTAIKQVSLDAAAARLADLQATIKSAEKEAADLKAMFKDAIPVGETKLFGKVMIGVSARERMNLDRGALVEHYGEEAIAPFCSMTEYLQVDVKKAS